MQRRLTIAAWAVALCPGSGLLLYAAVEVVLHFLGIPHPHFR